jgi:hypothetical protein
MPRHPDLSGAHTPSRGGWPGNRALVSWACLSPVTPTRTTLMALASLNLFLVSAASRCALHIATPLTTAVWLSLAICAMLADTAHATMSSRICGSRPCQRGVSGLCNRASPLDPAGPNGDDTSLLADWARHRSNAILNHNRVRPRRPLPVQFQNAVGVADNGHLQPRVCGVIVSPRVLVKPVVFLCAERTRGPPRVGAQSPRVLDGARDRQAPFPSDFYLQDLLSAPNATSLPRPEVRGHAGRARHSVRAARSWRPAPTWLFSGIQGAHGVTSPTNWPCGQYRKAPAAQSITATAQRFPPETCHECQTFLPRPQNSSNANYDEYESNLSCG